jgi:hypothetical protein
VWERAETSEKLGENRWPRITRNHNTRQRINDGGEASKGICIMKYRNVEGKKKVHGGVVTDITFTAKRYRKVVLLWNFPGISTGPFDNIRLKERQNTEKQSR